MQWERTRFHTKVLLVLWALFALLVSCRIHGSSIAMAAKVWDPKGWDSHFLASPLLKRLKPKIADKLRPWLGGQPRKIRSDEWAISTPMSLAQFSHNPRFPVINTNIGLGQNLLLNNQAPVLHPTAVVRPGTWGFLLFGPTRGLAWSWWFSPFFCFSALFLLFELLSPGSRWEAAFGAFWLTASPYLVAFSLGPACIFGFGAFCTVSAYKCLAETRTTVRLLWAGFLGLNLAGFVIILYPPWQVPLAYCYLATFVALAWRDGLCVRAGWFTRLITMLLSLAIASVFVFLFFHATANELKALAGSIYPGQRRLHGGDFPLKRTLAGFFNYITIYRKTAILDNESEAGGFFVLVPGLIIGMAALRRFRVGVDRVAATLMGLWAFVVIYGQFGLPQWLADATLWSRTTGARSQIAIGYLSIAVSVAVLGRPSTPTSQIKMSWYALCAASLPTFILVFWSCSSFLVGRDRQLPIGTIDCALIAAAAAIVTALILFQKRKLAMSAIAAAVVLTGFRFNPICVGYSSLERSEIYRAVSRIVREDRSQGRSSFWIPFGLYPPTLVSTMSARVLGGVYQHPQMNLWHKLDPSHANEVAYNRYATFEMTLSSMDDPAIKFTMPSYDYVLVKLSPANPLAAKLGARYVLTYGRQNQINDPPFKLLYSASDGSFKIWQLPEENAMGDLLPP